MKKIFALVLSMCILSVNVCGAVHFYDVNSNTEGGRAIYAMSEKGIISGWRF